MVRTSIISTTYHHDLVCIISPLKASHCLNLLITALVGFFLYQNPSDRNFPTLSSLYMFIKVLEKSLLTYIRLSTS